MIKLETIGQPTNYAPWKPDRSHHRHSPGQAHPLSPKCNS